MKVLGISPLDKDSTVSIVEDGVVLFAAGEERFSRSKQQDGFPWRAVERALDYTNTSPGDIDSVVYPFLSCEKEARLFEKNISNERSFIGEFETPELNSAISEALARVPQREGSIHGLSNANAKCEKSVFHKTFYSLIGGDSPFSKIASKSRSASWAQSANSAFRFWQQDLDAGLRDFGLDKKLKRMDHHLSHAANCFYTSGLDEALCITLDGYGTGLAGSVSLAKDGKITRLHGVEFPHSLGSLYEQVTSSLGYRPGRHEGKIVGLAAYGDPTILANILLDRIEQTPGDFRIFGSNNVFFSRYLASKFPKIDVAAAYQHVLEVVATNYIRHWVEKTGVSAVVLSGGVTANVKLNQRIFELEAVDRIFVYPNMGDGGCGTGAALYHSCRGSQTPGMGNAYLGPDFSETEIAKVLKNAGLAYSKPAHQAALIAATINDGGVVARFDGRMEYGPRALGNRSILYHAREPEVNQWLNKKMGRTEFMPFAPVTLYEDREIYYHNVKGAEHAAEFMTITFDCTERMKQECPAAVHVDGTARPQLIRRAVNPGYYDILSEYKKISGSSSLINTSFNMHEEPIVCTPEDAVRAFLQGQLDFLAIGPYWVQHPKGQSSS